MKRRRRSRGYQEGMSLWTKVLIAVAALIAIAFLVFSAMRFTRQQQATARALVERDTTAATLPPATTLEEIIRRNLEARGGQDEWQELVAYKREGRDVQQDTVYKLVGISKAPDLIWVSLSTQGRYIRLGYDGDDTWLQIRQGGREGIPQELTGTARRDLLRSARFYPPLYYFTQHPEQFELISSEPTADGRTYAIKRTIANDETEIYHLDSEDYLVDKMTLSSIEEGEPRVVEILFSDYRKVAGLRFPFSEETSIDGEGRSSFTLHEIILNPGVQQIVFSPPSELQKRTGAEG